MGLIDEHLAGIPEPQSASRTVKKLSQSANGSDPGIFVSETKHGFDQPKPFSPIVVSETEEILIDENPGLCSYLP